MFKRNCLIIETLFDETRRDMIDLVSDIHHEFDDALNIEDEERSKKEEKKFNSYDYDQFQVRLVLFHNNT